MSLFHFKEDENGFDTKMKEKCRKTNTIRR